MTEQPAKYGMRRKDRTITDSQLMEKMLRRASTCRLAFQDPTTGAPYIVPLTCGYAEGRLVFHAAKKGRKIDLIRKNGKAGFEIDFQSDVLTGENPCDWTIHFASIIGWGEIRLIEDDQGRDEALMTLMRHHGFRGEASFNPPDLKMTAVFELHIKEMSGKTNDPPWLQERLDD